MIDTWRIYDLLHLPSAERTVMPQIRFERTSEEGYVFKDALNLTDEEFATLTPAEIKNLQDSRFAEWIDLVRNPPPLDPGVVPPEVQ
jgi:hypothetical protein